jgi:hypothetical protein
LEGELKQMKMQTGTDAKPTKKRTPDTSLIIQQGVQFPRDLLASDLCWDVLTFSAAAYYVLGTIRESIQNLARRSVQSREPQERFERNYHLLISRHFRKAASDPLFQTACAVWQQTVPRLKPYVRKTSTHESGSQRPDFYENLTRKQIEALGSIFSDVRSVLMRQPQKVDGRALFEDLASLLARRPGPKKTDDSRGIKKKIIWRYIELVKRGVRPTPSQIARKVFSTWYSKPTTMALERDDAHRLIRNVLRPLGLIK